MGNLSGKMMKYQGNLVTVIEDNGTPLIRVKLLEDLIKPEPFLVAPKNLSEVSTEEFRNYVRRNM